MLQRRLTMQWLLIWHPEPAHVQPAKLVTLWQRQ
jgi:hypothetical protein